MPVFPSCVHKDGQSALGPVGAERHRVPSPPQRRNPRLEARWPDSRLFVPPSDAPRIVLDHTNLLADLIGVSAWDPRPTPHKHGVWFPGSAPRPRPPRSESKERAQRRVTARPNKPDRNTIFAPDDSRGSVLRPQVTFPDCRQHTVSDSAGEDEDPPPGDKVRGRPCPGASSTPLPLSLPVNNHRQADGCCDTCWSRCGKSSVQSGNQGQGGPSGLSPGRVWSRNRRMQSGGRL